MSKEIHKEIVDQDKQKKRLNAYRQEFQQMKKEKKYDK